jgi:hypothetical protein
MSRVPGACKRHREPTELAFYFLSNRIASKVLPQTIPANRVNKFNLRVCGDHQMLQRSSECDRQALNGDA